MGQSEAISMPTAVNLSSAFSARRKRGRNVSQSVFILCKNDFSASRIALSLSLILSQNVRIAAKRASPVANNTSAI